MAVTGYFVAKLLHVAFAATWVGALVYDWLFHARPMSKKPGREGLAEMVKLANQTTPFWVILAFGTVLTGYETARRLYGANPMSWTATEPGTLILWGLVLAIVAIVLGILQLPTKAGVLRANAEPGDEAAARLVRRAYAIGTIEVGLIAIIVVLMVRANVGG